MSFISMAKGLVRKNQSSYFHAVLFLIQVCHFFFSAA